MRLETIIFHLEKLMLSILFEREEKPTRAFSQLKLLPEEREFPGAGRGYDQGPGETISVMLLRQGRKRNQRMGWLGAGDPALRIGHCLLPCSLTHVAGRDKCIAINNETSTF